MSTVRVPPRLLALIRESDDWADWKAGKSITNVDLPLFRAIEQGQPDHQGAIGVEEGPITSAALRYWARMLFKAPGKTLADKRANVRSANAVLRAVNGKPA